MATEGPEWNGNVSVFVLESSFVPFVTVQRRKCNKNHVSAVILTLMNSEIG